MFSLNPETKGEIYEYMIVSCKLKKKIYPGAKVTNTSGYTVCEYVANEDIQTPTKKISKGDSFTAFGNFLPTAAIDYKIKGEWKMGKYGEQLSVIEIENEELKDIVSIKNYLSSGMIKGIGPKTAEAICDKFGAETIKVFEETPEKLLAVTGITKNKLEKIKASYDETKNTAELIGYLSPLGASSKKIMKIFRKYNKNSLSVVKEHPFKLCSIPGISYSFASQLAEKQGLPKNAPDRCQAALMYVLEQNEMNGNLFMSTLDWLNEALKLIDCPEVTAKEISQYAKDLIAKKKIKHSINPENKTQNVVYRMQAAKAENVAATEIMRVYNYKSSNNKFNVSDAVDEYEDKHHITLAPEQRTAVETTLKNKVSIITGGPGTGKTTVIGALYTIFKEKHKNAKILLCAPTGTAARKMAKATGMEAYTIHKAIGITVNEDEDEMETMTSGVTLDVDFVIVDEYSMADMYLTASLFSAIPDKASIVLIGDVDQLPSVGPGAVLSEIISSTKIPISKLIKIYRQKNGSKVALNAALIRSGREDLQYDDESFVFIEANSPEEAAEKMQDVYVTEIAINGVDNVSMLSPFKRKTASCSNELNKSIHDKVNPASSRKTEIIIDNVTYRVGDKVMQIKNKDTISNGDVGYITAINTRDSSITVDFGFQVEKYEPDSLDLIEHAYATSVHKSQGSEYEVVIINILNAHKVMLWRNLLYTAVTRAKRKVIIVGQKTAINTAIRNSTNAECKRNTMLAVRLRYL